jgi:hypothetical protein
MKLDVYSYVMTSEHISKAYFTNPSHRSVCPYVYPYMVARKFLGKLVLAATNTYLNRRIVGHVISYAIRVETRENRR